MLKKQARVAQLDRAFGYEPKGREFESCHDYMIPYISQYVNSKKEKSSKTFKLFYRTFPSAVMMHPTLSLAE